MTIDGALCCTTAFGELTFNPGSSALGAMETSMHTQAWCCTDIMPLWMPAAQRGSNVIVPRSSGTRAYRRRITETEYQLEMSITGVCDQDGFAWSNIREGLRQNLDWLAENVVDPPLDGSATREASLTSPDGLTTLFADVQVLQLDRGTTNADELIGRAVLHLLVPAGRFAEPVS